MSFIPEPKKQWYIFHVLSGQEQKVRERMLRSVEENNLQDIVFDILVPTETVSEIKSGEKKERKKKFYPGYIIVNMYLLTSENEVMEDSWFFIKQVNGILGFAGTKDFPLPMKESEVNAMLTQIKEKQNNIRPAVTYSVGDSVQITDGPFSSQTGIVEEIDHDKGMLRVSVTMFGRETPVELEFWQCTQEK